MKKTYDKETKNKCIQLRLQGHTVKSISEEYGLGVGTLKNWMDNYAKNPHTGDETDISILIKENAELRKELDFLKKATFYFAKNQNH